MNQKIFKDNFIHIKEFIKSEFNMNSSMDIKGQYEFHVILENMQKVRINYSPKKNTFKVVNINLQETTYEKIRVFTSTLPKKEDELNKEIFDENENIKEVKYYYDIFKKYRNCFISFNPLIQSLQNICSEDEKLKLNEIKDNFIEIERITLNYIS